MIHKITEITFSGSFKTVYTNVYFEDGSGFVLNTPAKDQPAASFKGKSGHFKAEASPEEQARFLAKKAAWIDKQAKEKAAQAEFLAKPIANGKTMQDVFEPACELLFNDSVHHEFVEIALTCLHLAGAIPIVWEKQDPWVKRPCPAEGWSLFKNHFKYQSDLADFVLFEGWMPRFRIKCEDGSTPNAAWELARNDFDFEIETL